ncbi:MAG TPA: prepilin-type N-terminal cleavage/methylation domain-containing protein [Thermoleophilaceae bacterium]|nr:prepilin-type N-terminal cleavage/methylation domain-containing protein [Thermoleophilaceae bacterium]
MTGHLCDDSGMTLIELMIGMSIALVVTFASLAVLQRATTASHEIADRTDALQRGRLAMETITRQLRSQVCLGETAEPISYGDGSTLTFYADLSDGSQNIERRRLTFVPPAGGAPGRIVEEVFPGAGVYPDLEFGTVPASSRVLLSGARQIESGGQARPVFSYFAFEPGSPTGDLEELTTPLSATDASRTIMVHIGFVAQPERRVPRDADTTTLENDVYVRLADPTRPLEGPRCL